MPRAMGDISTPAPVKLIVGMLSSRREWLEQAVRRMQQRFGPVDLAGEATEFTFTHYYDRDMGTVEVCNPDAPGSGSPSPLLRQFVAFERLISPEEIVDIKRFTNAVEDEFSSAAQRSPPRPVNLDPGYVAEGKLVLASTKDFAHRVYLGGGIYAEVTLLYGQGRWIPQKYTFPDYAAGAYDAFLTAARQSLRRQLGRKERPT